LTRRARFGVKWESGRRPQLWQAKTLVSVVCKVKSRFVPAILSLAIYPTAGLPICTDVQSVPLQPDYTDSLTQSQISALLYHISAFLHHRRPSFPHSLPSFRKNTLKPDRHKILHHRPNGHLQLVVRFTLLVIVVHVRLACKSALDHNVPAFGARVLSCLPGFAGQYVRFAILRDQNVSSGLRESEPERVEQV
jgi:hypothetical protein